MFAANKGSFTFKFSTAVQGSTKFELGAVKTTCTSTADTYTLEGHNYSSRKYIYHIDLIGKGWFASQYIGTSQYADGWSYTTDYGKINDNTYTLNISSDRFLGSEGQGYQIDGSGTLYQ